MKRKLSTLPFKQGGNFIRGQSEAKLFHFNTRPTSSDKMPKFMHKDHPAQGEDEDYQSHKSRYHAYILSHTFVRRERLYPCFIFEI